MFWELLAITKDRSGLIYLRENYQKRGKNQGKIEKAKQQDIQ